MKKSNDFQVKIDPITTPFFPIEQGIYTMKIVHLAVVTPLKTAVLHKEVLSCIVVLSKTKVRGD